jgi:hypothetical protein
MAMISIDEAKMRLADFNVLLKHIEFLQNNGFSDCGKGQIIGQALLLEEYLKEEERNNGENNLREMIQQTENAISNEGQTIKKNTELLHDNTNCFKPSLLKQLENFIDRAKDVRIENGHIHHIVEKAKSSAESLHDGIQKISDNK